MQDRNPYCPLEAMQKHRDRMHKLDGFVLSHFLSSWDGMRFDDVLITLRDGDIHSQIYANAPFENCEQEELASMINTMRHKLYEVFNS